MSKVKHTSQQYWNDRSELFGDYYKKPSLFDKIFRKAIYIRVGVAVDTCKKLDAPNVLDIGSGPGINSITILKNSSARHITGIDFAPNMISYAKEMAESDNLTDQCSFIEGDFLEYDFNETFDVSIALGVMDYTSEQGDFMKRVAAITNIAFVISWPENGFRMFLRRKRYTCPLYHFDEARIKDLHKDCDLKKLDIIKCPGGWVTVAWKN